MINSPLLQQQKIEIQKEKNECLNLSVSVATKGTKKSNVEKNCPISMLRLHRERPGGSHQLSLDVLGSSVLLFFPSLPSRRSKWAIRLRVPLLLKKALPHTNQACAKITAPASHTVSRSRLSKPWLAFPNRFNLHATIPHLFGALDSFRTFRRMLLNMFDFPTPRRSFSGQRRQSLAASLPRMSHRSGRPRDFSSSLETKRPGNEPLPIHAN